MIEAAAISEILTQYKKHGWTLRRVLLSQKLREKLSPAAPDVFGEVEIIDSSLDAAWFSRRSKPEFEAWEIRHLSSTPFALVEVLENSFSAEQAVEILTNAELKMIEITNSRRLSN